MRVAVGGSSGLLGTGLVQRLRRTGHQVVKLVRGAADSPDERAWNIEAGRIDGPGLTDVDAVVNLAGAGIADARWTSARKDELRRSRITSTLTVVDALEPDGRCRRFLSGSAIGFYGDAGAAFVTEDSPPGAGFLADLVVDWEDAAAHAPVPTAFLRTGNVLTKHGGFLGKQRPLFAAGLGGRFGDGRQYLSWIAEADWVSAVVHLLTSELAGPVNLVAPYPVTNTEFTAVFAKALHRPALLPVPLPAVRALFGPELVDEAMLGSIRARPTRLLADGFDFAYPQLPQALAAVA